MDSELAIQFGQVLRECRTKLGLSQETLAFNTELHTNHISFLERGLRQPSLETIFTLANALHLKPDELIRKVQEKV